MLWSLQLAAIARNWGSSWPTLRVQSLLAFIPQAWISSAPVRPATGARMQPGAGGGWLSPAVARIIATSAMQVTTTPARTTLRSLLVSRRRGVLTRLKWPSSGIAVTLSHVLGPSSRHLGELAQPIFRRLYVLAGPARRQAFTVEATPRRKEVPDQWIG